MGDQEGVQGIFCNLISAVTPSLRLHPTGPKAQPGMGWEGAVCEH